MLRKSEIAALARKLKWGENLTGKCVKNLFSDDSELIDGYIVKNEDVCDFLRVCIHSKFYPSRDHSIPNFFRNTFTGDIVETLIYFYKDTFFGPMSSPQKPVHLLSYKFSYIFSNELI